MQKQATESMKQKVRMCNIVQHFGPKDANTGLLIFDGKSYQASLIRAKTTVLEADFDRPAASIQVGCELVVSCASSRQVKVVNVEADAAAVNITQKARSSIEVEQFRMF